MKAHFFQHVPFEGLGSIGDWLDAHNAAISCTRFFEDPTLPDVDAVDLLIIMGGPMSVNDEDQYPWLADEKHFVTKAIEKGKAVLGICLGAQLIANALGSRVYPNEYKEIGWLPIRSFSESNGAKVFSFPEECLVFHWHGETFDLPAGAIRLASSEGCKNQAFQVGERVIGLQFHLETTLKSANEIVTNCRHELVPARYVQSEETILSAPVQHYAEINRLMARVLQFLTQPGA